MCGTLWGVSGCEDSLVAGMFGTLWGCLARCGECLVVKTLVAGMSGMLWGVSGRQEILRRRLSVK